MKIIITVNTYYPLNDGVQAVTQYQAEGLAKRGHEVTVITTKVDKVPAEEKYNGVHIIRLNVHTVHAIHRGDKKAYQNYILNVTKDADALINVCTQIALTDWVLPILDRIHCVKFLYMHGMIDFKWHYKDLASVNAFMHKVWNNIRWTYLYLALGKHLKKYDYVSQLHLFDDAYKFFKNKYNIDSVILENAADNEFFENTLKDDIILPDKYAINVSNYIERKNQKFCLEAYYKSNISNDYEMIFIGSNKTKYYYELLEYEKKLAHRYGKKKVQFLTDIPRIAIPYYVSNAGMFLMGSTWEAFPVSIVEAMAAGKPFITTNVGCVRFFPGGIIIKDAIEMSQCITLLANDDILSKSIGKSGYIFAVHNLTIESKVLQLENYLRTDNFTK